MNDLININTENETPTVMGRDLHEFLGITTQYSIWIDRMIEYGFIENKDFALVNQKRLTNNSKNPTTIQVNHQLTLGMAKEISMIQRNEKGKQARLYFIACEEELRNKSKDSYLIEDPIDRAEAWIAEQKEKKRLELENAEAKPKVDYHDNVLKVEGLMTISNIAKDLGTTGTKLNTILHELGIQYKSGRIWQLYAKYDGNDYTHTETVPTKGDFTVRNTKWTEKGRKFIYEVLKEKKGILPASERECINEELKDIELLESQIEFTS